MKYQVQITRVEYKTITIEIEDENKQEAELKALDIAPNIDFSKVNSHHSDYEIEIVELIDNDYTRL